VTAILAGAVLLASNLLLAPGQQPWGFDHPPKTGDRIRALTTDGLIVEGRFDGFHGSDMLVSSSGGHPVVLVPDRVQALWRRQRTPRPIVKYATRGVVLGVALGVFVLTSQWADGCYSGKYCDPNETMTGPDLVAMTTFFGMVGATCGMFVTHGPERLIYAAPPDRATRSTIQYTWRF
jgi:hypothetical protein